MDQELQCLDSPPPLLIKKVKKMEEVRETTADKFNKISPIHTGKLCNVYILNGWNHERLKGSKMRCSGKREGGDYEIYVHVAVIAIFWRRPAPQQ